MVVTIDGKRNILIIKQNKDDLSNLENRLIVLGYNTLSHTPEKRITRLLQESSVSAIIIGSINGITEEFREDFNMHEIPTFFIISSDLQKDMIDFIKLNKPFGYFDEKWDDFFIDEALTNAITHYENHFKKLQELEINNDLLNIFLKYNPSYVFFKDKDARTIKLSDNYADMLGMPIHEAVGKNSFELFPSKLAKSMVEDDMKILNEGRVIEVIEELKGRHYKTTKFPVIREGNPKLMAGFTIDITDLIEAEEALKISETKYRKLFEENRDTILLFKDNEIIDCNPQALRMLGYDNKNELIGMTVEMISEETQARGLHSDEILKLFRLKVHEEASFLFEWMLKKKDGTVFVTEVMLSYMDSDSETIILALIRDITERKAMELKLMTMAKSDSLTGIDNRREFNDKCKQEISRCKRSGYRLSFLMIDIDHFKVVNDTYGHFVGDLLLKQMVSEIKKDLRLGDYFARYGGEEFVVALVETHLTDAEMIAQRIRIRLSQLELNYDGHKIKPTVSIGVSELSESDNIVADPLRRADKAMYDAKELGRNRVEIYRD